MGLPKLGALIDALADQRFNPLKLNFVDDGTHIDAFVERRTDAELLHTRLDLRDQPFGHTLLHQKTGTGATDLALVEPNGVDETLNRAIEISVVKDHEGGLAAKLQSQLFAASGCTFPDNPADLG